MSELRLENWRMPGAEMGEVNPLPPLSTGHDMHAVEQANTDVPGDMLENMDYGRLPNIMPYALQLAIRAINAKYLDFAKKLLQDNAFAQSVASL